jgi:hypothetical protein
MSLIHALVARGTTVLAEHATGTAELKPGGYLRIGLLRSMGRGLHIAGPLLTPLSAAQITILSKIPPNNSKLTCEYSSLWFSWYGTLLSRVRARLLLRRRRAADVEVDGCVACRFEQLYLMV